MFGHVEQRLEWQRMEVPIAFKLVARFGPPRQLTLAVWSVKKAASRYGGSFATDFTRRLASRSFA